MIRRCGRMTGQRPSFFRVTGHLSKSFALLSYVIVNRLVGMQRRPSERFPRLSTTSIDSLRLTAFETQGSPRTRVRLFLTRLNEHGTRMPYFGRTIFESLNQS